MMTPTHLHPHDVGLPTPVIRQRRHAHRIARWMLLIAGLTALAGWPLYSVSVLAALKSKQESPFRAIVAYALLIISSTTLILGLWYLLLAQVNRIARMVESNTGDAVSDRPLPKAGCPNCGWPTDSPDRFCRHCGKPLGTAIIAPQPPAVPRESPS